jgi:hypothetical protein
MNNEIAYCGIKCTTCPLYVATLNDDVSMKREILLQYEKLYNRSFDIRDMECYGCKSKKKFFLSNNCNITPCNMSKGVETCSQCTNYPCERISPRWDAANMESVALAEKLGYHFDKEYQAYSIRKL